MERRSDFEKLLDHIDMIRYLINNYDLSKYDMEREMYHYANLLVDHYLPLRLAKRNYAMYSVVSRYLKGRASEETLEAAFKRYGWE